MMNHVLEHLGQDPDVFNKIISELYRICKNEASIQINVPHPRHDNFLSDPTHVRPINANVLSLYDKQLNEDWEQRNIANTPLGLILDVDFFVESVELEVDDVYKKKLANGEITEQELWSKISECNNICSEIRIKWRCRKPELGEESSKK
jgi:predicted SAM-dependent methyltransferase